MCAGCAGARDTFLRQIDWQPDTTIAVLSAAEPISPAAPRASAPRGRTEAPSPPDFAAVYEAHFAFVWRNVRRLGIADEAVDDVVQEVFLTVYRRLPSFEGRSAIRTWLFGIIRGVVSNQRRSSRRRRAALGRADDQQDVEILDDVHQPGPDSHAARAEAVEILYRILGELTDELREVLVLAELEQLPAPQIAAALKLSTNTVHSRLRAARRELDEAVARHRARDGRRFT